MKKIAFLILGLATLFIYAGCGKSAPDNFACTNKNPFSDSAALLAYAAKDTITPILDSTGLWYQIIDSGSNPKVAVTNNVYVTYSARLMGGSIFDSATNTNLQGAPIYNLILGWQIGLTKIGKGGHIKLLVPSAYGYGCTGYGPVPPDAPLYFDIYVLNVY